MLPLLEGQAGIVAGGGRGIGAAAAELLARAGAAVTVAARSEDEVNRVARRIRRAGGSAVAVPTDVADPRQARTLVRRTRDRFGRVDFLLNCAGVAQPTGQPTWETHPREWSRVIETNVVGSFNLCHAVIPAMLEQGEGRLLLVSSGLGERSGPFSSAYRASKAGVTHFARVLARELAGTGVTSNAVYPGLVDTELLHQFRSGADGAAPWAAYTRPPEDVAWFLLWLCGPGNRALTGQVVDIEDPLVQAHFRRFQRRCTLAGVVAEPGDA